ncbi:hypothetical protein [Acinetobacter shaoyimingii]|uniref:Uncharacterized protein n=1 Tax=Acinetobacter shaoyimingii TaxID=2715164 RepID=A0A6G8RS98_9GAMM|nr:hypothetical protein [Acinetobacter shaoyimingii]NHB56717.1 hypothetical protein [Acinetobacter shaoyimingii]QIO04781.1 hypothetical protein G8E00_01785 [Acinetobacter shaoyimingii]
MKALLLEDEVNQFHRSVLKSVLLVLSLLPLSQFFINLWHATDANSQIMLGFMGISIFTAWSLVSFCSALSTTVMRLNQHASTFEAWIIKIYGYVPMLSLTAMMSYLATQI